MPTFVKVIPMVQIMSLRQAIDPDLGSTWVARPEIELNLDQVTTISPYVRPDTEMDSEGIAPSVVVFIVGSERPIFLANNPLI